MGGSSTPRFDWTGLTTFEVILEVTDDNQEFPKVTEAVSYLRSADHWSIALWLARYLS